MISIEIIFRVGYNPLTDACFSVGFGGSFTSAASDPAAGSRKVTNTRYTLDGGFALPAERPLHVAVFACTRIGGSLAVATNGVRLTVG